MRPIDADAVKELIRSGISTDTCADQDYVCELVDDIPTIDAVSVVRCGECKLGGTEDCPMDEIDDEYFCNFGEREGE